MVRRKVRRREFGRGAGVVVIADVDPARATWDRRMLGAYVSGRLQGTGQRQNQGGELVKGGEGVSGGVRW